MQGAQSTGSRNRGIGRYTLSLVEAMLRNGKTHEIILALNGLFPDTIEPIRAMFLNQLPRENIRVWSAVPPVCRNNVANGWRSESAQFVREAFLASLRPDVIHVSSLFEGLGDDSVTSIGALHRNICTAVTLYDLIPYIHRKSYLQNFTTEAWYLEKIEYLRRADLLMAISESSRQEAIEHLGLPQERTVVISTDADRHFVPVVISGQTEQTVRQKYGLVRPFVMYTGGVDRRKNIEGLICAFARLPESLRRSHQLGIVCSAGDEDKERLRKIAKAQKLLEDEMVLTGFVPEDDLVLLYNLCRLFVFPSLHEGFGLPALEAMRCGAPVIGSNNSSIPEVIGCEEALFDPHSEKDTMIKILRGLSDEEFRSELISNGSAQAQKFSWDETAQKALASMEALHKSRQRIRLARPSKQARPRLAYISPLPPARSGIADYSAELLPQLSQFYEIDVIVVQETISDEWIRANCLIRSVSWFKENYKLFDRILYHFGNSGFHSHMFDLLEEIPGVIVLHDFFLSNVLHYMSNHKRGEWVRELYYSHGWPSSNASHGKKEGGDTVWTYPCNLKILQSARGVIVHSEYSRQLARRWYGSDAADYWAVIPLLRVPATNINREAARQGLGIAQDEFVVCSFGMLGPAKLNHRLVQAWLASPMAQDPHCRLIFVGENHNDYAVRLADHIRRRGYKERIAFTGRVDTKTFRAFLASADIAVQLRALSRGETSGAVLDVMNYGLTTIVNANGSMSDLDERAVWKLQDEFTDEELIEALIVLWKDDSRRYRMGESARDIIIHNHSPQRCAALYEEAIERFCEQDITGQDELIEAIAGIHTSHIDDTQLIQISGAIARSIPSRPAQRQLLIDVSELVQYNAGSGIQHVARNILAEWLHECLQEYRIEPVYATEGNVYKYARSFTQRFLGYPKEVLRDGAVEYAPGDIFFGLDPQPQVVSSHRDFYRNLRRQGAIVKFLVHDLLCVRAPQYFGQRGAEAFEKWLSVITESDGAVCISQTVAQKLADCCKEHFPERLTRFKIDWLYVYDINESVPGRMSPVGKLDQHSSSDGMPWLSWSESSKRLLGKILPEMAEGN
ncbi:MAG TPA: glycosyltransferase [Syntrophorhabdaceae bacterium]|nr:glycosyltransferase [Syntrophorhabdaceae bacterium]